jgi:hypothetical protein
MTSLVNPGLGDGYQDEGSLGECLREDVKTLREEFLEDGAVKQQRPSAHRLRVKGTEEDEEKPRNNEVIGTLNGPAKDEGEWERWGRVTGGWARGPVAVQNQGLLAFFPSRNLNWVNKKLAGKQAER